MTTPEQLGTTPLDWEHREALRITLEPETRKLGLGDSTHELVRRASAANRTLTYARAEEILMTVADAASVNYGEDFTGQVYRARHIERLSVTVEIDVPGYLAAHPHQPEMRRHALEDLPPQAQRELRDALRDVLPWVTDVRSATPHAQLIWR